MTLLPVLLPQGYVAKVSVGDKLTVGKIIAEKKGDSTLDKNLPVTQFLNTAPKNIFKVLKKHLGDGILQGDVVAIRQGAFGVGSKKFISEFSGTITKINEQTGEISLRVAGVEGNVQTIISPVDGTVDICNNEKIVIKTDKDAVVALDGVGDETEGEIFYFETLEETKLNSEVAGKIILAKTVDKVSLFKAIGLDAAGIIAESLENLDFVDLQEKKLAVPVVLVNDSDFKRLVKQNGKKVYLSGKDKSIIVL